MPPGANHTLEWRQWDGTFPLYNITLADAQPAYRAVLQARVRLFIYNGLRDTGVPAEGAEKWVPRVAGDALRAPRRKWGAPPDGRIAGEVTEYASGLTFATLEGAGHLVPGDRPQAARVMIDAFLRGVPLPPYEGQPCNQVWLGRGWGAFC